MEEKPVAEKGYVYILVNPAFTNYVKIGKTIKDPQIRAQEISSGTGVPAPYQVVWDRFVSNCNHVERVVHQELSPYRARNDREFFSLTPKQAISLVERITAPYSCEEEEQSSFPLASELKNSAAEKSKFVVTSNASNGSPNASRSDGLKPADKFYEEDFAPNSDPYIQSQLSNIVKVILNICPDCLVKRRGDGALIFVPPERKTSSTQKNLITIWPKKSTMRLRIMPEPEEPYIPENLSKYEGRLNTLYSSIINHNN